MYLDEGRIMLKPEIRHLMIISHPPLLCCSVVEDREKGKEKITHFSC